MNTFVVSVTLLAAVCSVHAAPEKKPTVANQKTEYLRYEPGADPAASSAKFQQRLRERFISMRQPEYPDEARRHWREGHGLYRVIVDTTGKVTAVQVVVSAGERVFDDEVQATFRRWRAKPGPPLVVELPVMFVLNHTGRTTTESRIPERFSNQAIFNTGPQPTPGNR